MLQLDEKSDGQEVALHVGQTLQISLPENRTAGYRWILRSVQQDTYALVGDSYEGAAQPLGRPGVHSWRFEARRAGHGDITLAYVRPWEPGQPPGPTFARRRAVSGPP
jgi:inhibitor of cysteine peptidase